MIRRWIAEEAFADYFCSCGNGESDLSGKQDDSKFGLDDEDGIVPKFFPIEVGFVFDGALRKTMSFARKAFQLLDSSPNKVPIKWPKSRDKVWKENIPHTHLAHKKSDQNWMVVKGEKIIFPGGGTYFHYGYDKDIKSLANMLNFPRDVFNNEGNL
ncbi:probable methyltransferase PMT3 [Tanacetum coccineum]